MIVLKLSKDDLEVISKAVLKERDRAIKKEKQEHKDWRLRNTSLLLKNYQKLSIHCQGIDEDVELYEGMTYDPSELDLHNLMKYKAKTAMMLRYFESIFKAYGELSKRQGEVAERRYKIVRRMYIDKDRANATELADYWNIDRSTVFRDSNKAIEELSIMLFGIDSFEDLT